MFVGLDRSRSIARSASTGGGIKLVWGGFIVVDTIHWKMNLSWRLELEFAGISSEFRVSTHLRPTLLFVNSVTSYL